MDVILPDGTVVTGVPDNMTKAQFIEKARANGYDVSKLTGQKESNLLMDALNYIPSLGDAAARGVIGAGSRALTGVQALGGSLSGLVGREEEAAQRFKAMEDRQRSTEQFLKETYPDTGTFREKLVGGAAQIPSYINPLIAGATILGTGIEEQQQANQLGVDPETAKRAGYIGSIGNAAMMALPGAGAVKGTLVGGGTAFAGEQAQVANLALSGYEKAAAERKKEVFDATLIGAIIGGGVGAATRPSKPKPKPESKPVTEALGNLDAISEQKKQQTQTETLTAEQQAAEAAAVQAGALRTQQGELALDIPNEVDVSGVRNPYDVGGRISDLAAGMETTIDSPQLDLFAQGLRDQAYNRPDIQAAELALLQAKDQARSTQEQGAINRELEAGYRLLEQDKPRDALGRPLYDQQPFLVQPGDVQEGAPINLGSRIGTDPSGIPSLADAMQAANQRPLTAAGANPSMYPPGGPQMGMAPSRVPKTNLNDIMAKQMSAVDSAWESTASSTPRAEQAAVLAPTPKSTRPLTEIQQIDAFGKALGSARPYPGVLRGRVNLQAQKAAIAGDFQGVINALSKSKNLIVSEIAKKAKKLNTKIVIDNNAAEQLQVKSSFMRQMSIDGATMHLEALAALRALEPQIKALPDGSALDYEITGKRIQALENGQRVTTISLANIAEMGHSMFSPLESGPLKLRTKEDFQTLLREFESLTKKIGEADLKLTSTGSKMVGAINGMYDAKTDTIRIEEFSARDESTLAHEIVHAQVLKAVANPNARQQPIVKRLETLYDFVKSKLEGSRLYGLASIQEFIAEGMANPAFQFRLNQIEYKNQSAWKSFTTTVANLIGVKSGTSFTELLSIYGDLTTGSKTNLKDATANLVDAIASATGAKQNFLKDGGIRTAAKDFVNALWDAGSRKWSEVLAKGRELFGDTWSKIGQVVKAEWDSFVLYQKAISAGKAGSFANDPTLQGITKTLGKLDNSKTQISRAVDSAFSSMEFPKSPDELKAESFKAIPGMKDTPYVAKDPVFENEKPNILAEGKDGGRFWFMTPGRLMAQELRNSNLIKTVGRLFENARNRAAYYNRTVLEPIKREVKRISANDNEVILLRDIMHKELKNGTPFTPEELLSAGVSPELSGVLQKMRAAYADVLAKENAARVEAGLKPITALDAYYASRWVGPWTAEVRLKVEVGDNRPHGKLVYFIRERSKGSLNNAIEWVKQKHPELEIINNGYDKNYSLKKGRIEAGYEAMLQILGPEDPLIKDIDAWMKERATQTTENVLGQEKHFKAKSGKLGYAGSRPWVDAAKDAREFLQQQLQYIENGYIWSENQTALREMKKYTSDADILKQQPNNVKYVKELAKLELGQGTLKEIDALENLVAKGLGGNTGFGHMAVGVAKSIFYLKTMGLSTPYIVVSLLQPALVLPPALIHAKGSFKDAIPALSDGPYVLARTLLDDYNYQNPKLNELADFVKKKKDPFVEEAYRYARDNQVTEVNPLDEIRDPANTSGVPRSIEVANKTVGATISLPEIASRSFVYMSFVHGLRNKFDTSTPEGRLQLFEKAAEMTGFAMGVYRKEQKAPIYQRMGMAGNALSTLTTFPLTYMAQGWKYIKEAKKGNPVPLLAFMGTSLMMAGATGLINLDDAIDLYNFVKRWMLTPSQYAFLEKYPMLADPKGWLVKNTPDWVSYGPVSSLTGTNLYTRTSMGDVVQFGPFESSTSNIIESMFPFVAELYKTGEGAWDIGVGVAKGDMKRIKEGGYAMTPSGLRGLYEETVPGFREGTIIKRPSDLKEKQVDRPEDEAFQRMLGFRSLREQKELDLGFANRTQEELRAKQYKNAADELLNAIYNQKGIPDAFETWVALGGDPRNLNQVQKRYILNSVATKLQQDAMKAKSSSPAERMKAQRAIEIFNELQR